MPTLTLTVYGGVLARLLLAFVFGVAGLSKARDRPHFEVSLTELTGLSEIRAGVAAWLTIVAELSVSLLLLVGNPALLTVGLVVATLLLLMFTYLLARGLSRGVAVSCGCFGSAEQPVSRLDIVRNLLLLGCICVVAAACVRDLSAIFPDLDLQRWTLIVLAASASTVFIARLGTIGLLIERKNRL